MSWVRSQHINQIAVENNKQIWTVTTVLWETSNVSVPVYWELMILKLISLITLMNWYWHYWRHRRTNTDTIDHTEKLTLISLTTPIHWHTDSMTRWLHRLESKVWSVTSTICIYSLSISVCQWHQYQRFSMISETSVDIVSVSISVYTLTLMHPYGRPM